MIQVRNVKVSVKDMERINAYLEKSGAPDDGRSLLYAAAAKALKISPDKIDTIKLYRRSLDSRHHDDIHYVLTLNVSVSKNVHIRIDNKNIMSTKEAEYEYPHFLANPVREFLKYPPEEASRLRPVIIGAGPAGYFAALKLARAGFCPIVIERGQNVDVRTQDVEGFFGGGALKKESNVAFGEGGAGTFSDGKLNTGNKDKHGYFREVMQEFYRCGAPESVTYDAKPHIGTDRLRLIMRNMREKIISFGGDVRFGSRLDDIHKIDDGDAVYYRLHISCVDGSYELDTSAVVLAIGHSARDTYAMLMDRGYSLEPKPYAMGVRIEHSREAVNRSMYGDNYHELYGDMLPSADYKLVEHDSTGRAVFSFCMCPGGYVVDSSSDEGMLSINGMSYSDRMGDNSNSAIVVSVTPEDVLREYGGDSNSSNVNAKSAIKYQESIEEAFYRLCNGSIPWQTYGEFKAAYSDRTDDISKTSCTAKSDDDNLSVSTVPSEEVIPQIKGSYTRGNVGGTLPKYIYDAIIECMPRFAGKVNAFADDSAVVSGPETRTSSPVRMPRDEHMMAEGFPGVFPIGEGAGYAGGITSSAADGIKAYEAVSEYLTPVILDAYTRCTEAAYKAD